MLSEEIIAVLGLLSIAWWPIAQRVLRNLLIAIRALTFQGILSLHLGHLMDMEYRSESFRSKNVGDIFVGWPLRALKGKGIDT